MADRLPGAVLVAKDDTRDVELPDVFVRWGSRARKQRRFSIPRQFSRLSGVMTQCSDLLIPSPPPFHV